MSEALDPEIGLQCPQCSSMVLRCGRKELALLALLVGFCHRRVELDQDVAGLDALSATFDD